MLDDERDRLLLQINEGVVELRTVVLGTNGFRGMQGLMEDMGHELNETKNDVVDVKQKLLSFRTLESCDTIHNELVESAKEEAAAKAIMKQGVIEKKDKAKMTVREWVLIVITALGVLSGLAVAIIK